MYAPIDGLRLLAVETSLLIAFSILAFLFLRFSRFAFSYPRWLQAVLAKNSRAVLLVIGVALVGRALLLPWVGIPQPRIDDEYAHLLMADTFSHFRLTNPTPAAWQHFETFQVNLTPTYHSKYAVAQGLALAFGKIVFHLPWIGVYLSTALLCGAICWALQAFVPPGWALLGGLLAAFRFAFLSYWMNSYWGGSMAALGGALALGSVVRLFNAPQTARHRALLASLFAISLLLLATSRPYEGLAYSIPLLVYFAYKLVRGMLDKEIDLRSTVVPVAAIGLAGLLFMGYYNQRTTHDPLLLPHLLNERTYSPFPLFLWQRTKPDMTFRDPAFAKFYEVTRAAYNYEDTKSLSGLWSVESGRIGSNWFFYVGVALTFPVFLGILSSARAPHLRIVLFAAASVAVALALCIYTLPHYASPATVTLYVFVAEGLRYLWQQHSRGEQAFVIGVCLTVMVTSLTRQTGATAVHSAFAFPNVRALIAQQIEKEPGKHLVLVSYDMEHHYPGEELVHNGADFASEKILWARSKGAGHDSDLCQAYSDRTFWTVTSNDVSFSLHPVQLCGTRQTASPATHN